MAVTQFKRRRVFGLKVKTGCKTCKIRRVKCDEAKPSCQRCTSTGRKCDGYIPVASSRESSADEGPNLDIVRRITSISGSTKERRGFQYFLTNTAIELTGYFSPNFWEHFILQASVAEPCLKHAIISIGSLHESFLQNRSTCSQGTTPGFATDQYLKAISHLRRSLAAGNERPITILMSCILFVCFDSLRGHLESAMAHLQSGLKILRDIGSRPDVDKHMIVTYIIPIFVRLSVQSVLYFDTRRKQEKYQSAFNLMSGDSMDEDIPEAFETLEEARTSINKAVNGLFRTFYMYDEDLPMSAQPPETFILYPTYTSHLQQWNKAFEALLRTKSSKFTTREVRGAALLKIHHMTCRVMANTIPDIDDPRPAALGMDSPECFAKYHQDFLTIITLSRSLIAATEADMRAGKAPLIFSTDLGLVAPLYYVCIKCQSHEIRKAALDLLGKLPRKEGMWDDASSVKLIKGYWTIQERHKKLAAIDPAFKEAMPMNRLVSLKLRDGLIFEWKWNGPADELGLLTNPIQSVEFGVGGLP